jgi:hypothetical protein
MMAKRLPFRALGRDLYFDLQCTCPDPLFKDSDIAHLMKRRITLTGYADDYFFDVVNKEPRQGKCSGCGRPYTVQWFRDGVEAGFTEMGSKGREKGVQDCED